MVSVLEGKLCKLKVGPDGSDDGDDVHLSAGPAFPLVGGDGPFRMSATPSRERLGVLVADRDNIGLFVTLKIANNVWTPIAVTDDADADNVSGKVCAERKIGRGSNAEASSHPDSPDPWVYDCAIGSERMANFGLKNKAPFITTRNPKKRSVWVA